MCVQVAFIIAGSTHATYYKTLQHALGINSCQYGHFFETIEHMHPVVKAMLDVQCEAAKHEMKDKKEDELGSWGNVQYPLLMACGKPWAGIVKMPHLP